MASLLYVCVHGFDGASVGDARDAPWAVTRAWRRAMRAVHRSLDWRDAFAWTKELYMGDED
jgi:hypothetical protein